MMSINKRAPGLPHYAFESDRLQRVLSAAARVQADLIRKTSQEMNHIDTQSVREALRSNKRKQK
jgi:hypothetical protein